MNGKRVLVLVIVLVTAFSLAACGGSKDVVSEKGATLSTADQQEVIDRLAEEAAAVPEPETRTEAAEAAPDETGEAVDKLLGDWVDINDETRLVTIAKDGDVYQYTDSDGTYTGTVSNGVLAIRVSDAENDTADVFIDAKTGNMVTNYQGDIYEFTRKIQQ